MAAAFVLTVIFCAINPVLARKLPILGDIFGKAADTFAVALDADGNLLESAGGHANVLPIAGHDISKAYIYICEYIEYMDELKGYAYPGEGDERDKSFQEILEERALFKTVVEIPE